MYQIKINSSVLKKGYDKVLPGTSFTIRFIPTDKDKISAGSKGTSGKGPTRMQEELQCLYTAYRFQLGSDLKESNCNDTNISAKDVVSKCFFAEGTVTKKIAQALYDDMEDDTKANNVWLKTYPEESPSGQNVFMKIANEIAKHPWAKKFGKTAHFHRGSAFTKKIYKAKEEAFENEKAESKGGFVWTDTNVSDDKWNPADIWMVKPEVTEPFCVGHKEKGDCATLDMLKDSVVRHAKAGQILGISLKKTGSGPAKLFEFNAKEREHNEKTTIKSFSLQGRGARGDFFTSMDVYLHLSLAKLPNLLQLRTFGTTKNWQGEVVAGAARAGKASGPILNYFIEKFLGRSIGKPSVTNSKWKEGGFDGKSNKDNMYKLYKKFSLHKKNLYKLTEKQLISKKDFISTADVKVPKTDRGFYISKYLGLLFLEAFYANGTGDSAKHTLCSTKIARYAMSNLDISSYYIKVS